MVQSLWVWRLPYNNYYEGRLHFERYQTMAQDRPMSSMALLRAASTQEMAYAGESVGEAAAENSNR